MRICISITSHMRSSERAMKSKICMMKSLSQAIPETNVTHLLPLALLLVLWTRNNTDDNKLVIYSIYNYNLLKISPRVLLHEVISCSQVFSPSHLKLSLVHYSGNPCTEDEVRCPLGTAFSIPSDRCIRGSHVCDGVEDCIGGTDEEDCSGKDCM